MYLIKKISPEIYIMEYSNKVKSDSNRIELKVNGRIFPHWVLKNFKKYTLPDIIRGKDEDPCQEKILNELNPYQKFVGQFLNYKSPFSDILLFHGLGSGKLRQLYMFIMFYLILHQNGMFLLLFQHH